MFLSQMVGLVGIGLLIPWYLLSRYIGDAHRAKIDALIELDQGKLTKSLYVRERELLDALSFTDTNWKLVVVENYHLLVLLVLCLLLIAGSHMIPAESVTEFHLFVHD